MVDLPEENEAAEALAETRTTASVTANVEEELKVDAQLKDKADIAVDEAMNDKSEGMSGGEECERVTKLDIDDQKKIGAEMGGDKAESENNTYEDDEIHAEDFVLGVEDEENADFVLGVEDEEKADSVLGVEDEEDADFVLGVEDEENAEYDDFSDVESTEEDNEDDVSEEEAMEEDEEEVEVSKEENTPEETEIAKQGKIDKKTKVDGQKAKEHNTTKLEKSLKIIKKSSERSKKKKEMADMSKKVDLVDKPDSSRKKKGKKRVESMGMIFMCSSVTKNDCFQYRVFGLPESKKADVEKIYTGMRLFLYDVDLKLMYGIYKAAGPGGYNIVPKAFKSQFPSQVRYKVLENCLPLAEEKFKNIIKENYYTKTKFECKLNSEQVKNLCKLFVASSEGRPSKKLGKSLKVENPPVRKDRPRRKRGGRKRGGRERNLPLMEVNERPRKRPRKAISPARPLHQRAAPQPSTLPSSYAYERTSDVDAYRRDPYSERRDSYRDRRDPSRRSYGDRRDPPVERNDRYRDGHDRSIERNDRYRDGRDSYLTSYYVYRDAPGPYIERREVVRDPYLRRRDPYRDGREPYLEGLPDLYKDRQDPTIERHDRRDPYLELRLPYRDVTRPELYSSYRRDLLTDVSDVYGGDRGIEYRSSYRREGPLETRQRHDIASRDSYALTRERPSFVEPVYTAEYSSRAGLYHL